MTTEEKARAYDEALEDMRVIYPNLRGDAKLAVEHAFPELAESEDESTRKALIETVKCIYAGDTMFLSEQQRDRYLDWLGKQKENPKSDDSIPSDCTSDARCEDRWHKVTDSLPDNGRLVLAKDCLGNVLLARYDGENWEVNVYDNEDHYCHNSISKWCEIPSEKQQESLHIPETSKENANSFTDEDERIRRTLVEYFGPGAQLDFVRGVPIQKIREWLEKQKECHSDDVLNSTYQEGFEDGFKAGREVERRNSSDNDFIKPRMQEPWNKEKQKEQNLIMANSPQLKEQKPAEWSDTKELVFKDICNHLKEEGYSGWVLLLNALHNGEFQPKPEWSEEDSDNLERVDNYLWMLDKYVGDDCAMPQGKTDKIRGNIQEVLSPWLKSLPERFNLQPKQEWSEEDEERVKQLIYDTEAIRAGYEKRKESLGDDFNDELIEDCDEQIKWLKSLRPSWKPSEEQMKALNALNCHGALSYVGQQNQLISLYQDLKKLM